MCLGCGGAVPKLRIYPNLLQREAQEWFKVEYDISVNERMMYRAMNEAKDVIEGTEKDQYLRLRDYMNEIMKVNPGSIANMGTTPQPEGLPRFRNLYICLAACTNGFKAGCRPFIVLDGTFLKGYFGGQLLIAIGQDVNNQLFPIAYGVVDAETRKNWRFFLEELHIDIGDYNENAWVFMSDQQKGLIPALQDVMPGVKNRFCSIQRKNEKPEDYVRHKLTIEAYNRTYQFHINSIPSQEYWEHHEGLPCLPPTYKRPIGRPTKKR
ncbi:uncharacterized protein [Arachis hypogaea]|uniref:uncharacterized protein n=1 Tax=Arachis hypogaea TaxID=3818 RepID=UPI003B217FBC